MWNQISLCLLNIWTVQFHESILCLRPKLNTFFLCYSQVSHKNWLFCSTKQIFAIFYLQCPLDSAALYCGSIVAASPMSIGSVDGALCLLLSLHGRPNFSSLKCDFHFFFKSYIYCQLSSIFNDVFHLLLSLVYTAKQASLRETEKQKKKMRTFLCFVSFSSSSFEVENNKMAHHSLDHSWLLYSPAICDHLH